MAGGTPGYCGICGKGNGRIGDALAAQLVPHTETGFSFDEDDDDDEGEGYVHHHAYAQ